MTGEDPYPLLSGLDSPLELRRLSLAQLPTLAAELRAFLAHNVGSRPVQPESVPGSVELAIAVHYIFNSPDDRIVWDGGQQSYAHKVLTGRRERLSTIGQPDGLKPFPNPAESEYDTFGVGHSSTSISAALGMAIAAARRGETRRVVAILDDKALTSGMTFEALNHAGSLNPKPDLLVIVEDKGSSLPGGSGLISNEFARVLSGWVYTQLRERGKRVLRQMPTVWELARRSEEHLKGMVLPGTLFEELGFNYIGPVDGHDLGVLIATLGNLKRLHGPHLLHVVTPKGKSAETAANEPKATEPTRPVSAAVPAGAVPAGVTPLREARSNGADVTTSYSHVFGQWLCDMAAVDPRIVCVTPAAPEDSGLREFAARFPDRCFDLSIAHQHAVTFAAGLATEGLRPVVAISSTYLQRTYDQLIHDVALQRLPVMFAVDRAGFVDGDGATHQGSYDLSFLRCVPNFTIMAPTDENECRQMLYTARTLPGPAVVRYPRGNGPGVTVAAAMSPVPLGRAQVCREGRSRLALLVFGAPLAAARTVAARLDATLVNMRFVKPLDLALLTDLCTRHRALVTIEENAVAAGAGSAVVEALAAAGVAIPLLQLGIPDRFIEHGSRETSLAAAGLDAAGILESIERWLDAAETGVGAAGGRRLVAAHQQPLG